MSCFQIICMILKCSPCRTLTRQLPEEDLNMGLASLVFLASSTLTSSGDAATGIRQGGERA